MTEKELVKMGFDPNPDILIMTDDHPVKLLVKEMVKSLKKKGYFPEKGSLYLTQAQGEDTYRYQIGFKDIQGDLIDHLNIDSCFLRDVWFGNDKSVYKTAKDEIPGLKNFVKQVKKLLKDMGRYQDPAEKEDIGL